MSEIIKSESIKELAVALAKAQGKIQNPAKNNSNTHFKTKYADLAEVLNSTRPVLSEYGLSVVQLPGYASGIVTVTTILMHSSGEFIQSECSAPAEKQHSQGIGSALTYLRRYALAAVCGVAQEDDDGNAASEPADNRYGAPGQQAAQPKQADQKEKPELTPDHKGWTNAIASYRRLGNFSEVLPHMNINPANRALIIEQASEALEGAA